MQQLEALILSEESPLQRQLRALEAVADEVYDKASSSPSSVMPYLQSLAPEILYAFCMSRELYLRRMLDGQAVDDRG